MAQTYIGSTLRTGSGTLTDTTDGGFVVTAQTTTVTTVTGGTAVSSTITIPASSQIIDFFIDCVTLPVVGGGTATTVPITIAPLLLALSIFPLRTASLVAAPLCPSPLLN